MSGRAGLNRLLWATILVCLTALPAAAQLEVPRLSGPPPDFPFEKWILEKNKEQIRWNVRVTRPELSIVQRQMVQVEVEISGKELRKRGGEHELWLMAALRDSDGDWMQERGLVGTRLESVPPKSDNLVFSMQILLLPGEFELGVVLLERISGHRNVHSRKLKINPLRGDPLPDANRNLPRVEFLQPLSAYERSAAGEFSSRLWLPAPTKRPVQVELLINFAPSEGYAGRGDIHKKNVATMLGILLVLSQLELPNGTLNITGVDISRRKVIFEQEDVVQVEWSRLRRALQQISPYTVSARDLTERRRNAAFFRELIGQKLAAPGSATGGSTGGSPSSADPMRVVIVVSSPLLLARGSDLAPLDLPHGPRNIVYHLRYQIAISNVFDDFSRVLERLEPHRFHVDSPISFRRALARMLAELRSL